MNDEAPHAAWVDQHTISSEQWTSIRVTPHSLISLLHSSPTTPLVFLLDPGVYELEQTLCVHREAPCVVRTEACGEAAVFTWAAKAGDAFLCSAARSDPTHPVPLLHFTGSGDVVWQRSFFDAVHPTVHTPLWQAGIVIETSHGGRVCLTDCRFRAPVGLAEEESLEGNVTDEGTLSSKRSKSPHAAVVIRKCGAAHFSQCEFVGGSCGLWLRELSAEAFLAAPAAPIAVVSIDDCGFIGASSDPNVNASGVNQDADTLLHTGVRWDAAGATGHRVIIDHSSFEGLCGPALDVKTHDVVTPSVAAVNELSMNGDAGVALVILQGSTVTRCGEQRRGLPLVEGLTLLPAIVTRGRSVLHVTDTTINQCGPVVLEHVSTAVMREVLFQNVFDVIGAHSAASVRHMVVQDKASLLMQRCEWSTRLVGTQSMSMDEGPSTRQARAASMVITSTGSVTIDGNSFVMSDEVETPVNVDVVQLQMHAFAHMVIDGSAAPRIQHNRFESVAASRPTPEGEEGSGDTSSGCASVVGVLFGLWHDAKFESNLFTGRCSGDNAFGALEDFPHMTALVTPYLDARSSPLLKSADDADSPPAKADGCGDTKPSQNRGDAASEATVASASGGADSSEAQRKIAALEATVRQLQQELLAQRTRETLRDEAPDPRSSIRTKRGKRRGAPVPVSSTTTPSCAPRTAARPLSAGASRKLDVRPPSAGKSQRPLTAGSSRTPRDDPARALDREVSVGPYRWKYDMIKAFMEGRCTLGEVRRPRAEEGNAAASDAVRSNRHPHSSSNSPSRGGGPEAIYESWKRSMSEKKAEEEAMIRRREAEMEDQRKRLTSTQLKEHVMRLHTESIQRQKEVREKCFDEEMRRHTPRGRSVTLQHADALLENAGDFDDRLKKDMKDRAERREKLLRKYIPEKPTSVRSKSEIEAYVMSLHKSHHDAVLVEAAARESGTPIRVAPPRCAYPPKGGKRLVLRPDELTAYCRSLYNSHRDESLATQAAAIAGNDVIVRVGARSSSRGLR